jgi:hypothetical protein
MQLAVKRYDGLIRLESSFYVQFSVFSVHFSVFSVQFSCFCIKMCYNLYHGMLELAEIWNLG